MKILRNNEQVKDAKVIYGQDKQPEFVEHGGIRHLASAFTFEEDKPKTKTKQAPKPIERTKKPAENSNDTVMTTEDVKPLKG